VESTPIAKLIEWSGGRLERGSASGTAVAVETDSRRDCAGAVFVPLVGEKFDGHEFIASAAARGAAGCLTSKDIAAGLPESFAVIRVADTLKAYQAIARGYRRTLPAKVAAITGSCGKTTTKNMLANALSRKKITKTEKNENNEVGVPLTLLRMDSTTEIAVLEFGMRGRGQIAELAEIAEPELGLITNIEASHIGILGSMEAICDAKGELLERLPARGTAVLNADSEWFDRLAKKTSARIVSFGMEKGDYRAAGAKMRLDGSSYTLETPFGRMEIESSLTGRGAIINAAAVAAAAMELGEPLDAVAEGLAMDIGEAGRMRRVGTPDGKLLIDDTYNSSPASLAMTLELLGTVEWSGRRVAALGDMKELGDFSRDEHFRIGRDFAAKSADALVTVGSEAKAIAEGALYAGMREDGVAAFETFEEFAESGAGLFGPGDLVLVKGSRAMGMERVVKFIEEASK